MESDMVKTSSVSKPLHEVRILCRKQFILFVITKCLEAVHLLERIYKRTPLQLVKKIQCKTYNNNIQYLIS